MPRRAPVGAAIVATTGTRREPPPGAVVIPGIYSRLTEMAREVITHGDSDPRCVLDGSEDHDRFDPDRRGNVEARAELAALLKGDDVRVSFWRIMDATDKIVMPVFPRGIRQFHVGRDGFVWPVATERPR